MLCPKRVPGDIPLEESIPVEQEKVNKMQRKNGRKRCKDEFNAKTPGRKDAKELQAKDEFNAKTPGRQALLI